MKYIYILLIIISSNEIYAQKFELDMFQIPNGYKYYKDGNGKDVKCESDFDFDNKNDLAILCTDTDETKGVVFIFLSTKVNTNSFRSSINWDLEMFHDFHFENKTLVLKRYIGFGSNFTLIFKLQYFSDIKNMRLINYISELNFETIQSVDLITGKYQLKEKSGIDKFEIVTISNINKHLEFLWFYNGLKK